MLVLWSSEPIIAVLDTVYSCEPYTVCFHCWAKHSGFQTYFTKPKATDSIIFLLRSWIHGFYCWLFHDIWAFAVAFRPQAQACGHHTCSIKSLHEACNTFCNWDSKKKKRTRKKRNGNGNNSFVIFVCCYECVHVVVLLIICICSYIFWYTVCVCFLITIWDSINGISVWFLLNQRLFPVLCRIESSIEISLL